MARRRDVEAAVRAAGMGKREKDELAEKLLRAKTQVYRRTLRRLAERFTSNAPSTVTLSKAIMDGLRRESERHARQIARTHNRAVADRALEISSAGDGRSRSELREELREWGAKRMRKRAKMIAVTEAYGPHADATLSFFRDAGVEPEFEFGGHIDDSDPACALCQALTATNPHSLEEVVAVGTPHPNCRQTWHPVNFDEREIPDELTFGASLGGIVGGETMVGREGGTEQAADAVLALRRG